MRRNRIPERSPGLGDRVRFRDAYMALHGVIVDELTEAHVQVRWDGVATPSAHRREDLQIDSTASSSDGAS